MLCPSCGQILVAEAAFCYNCGARVTAPSDHVPTSQGGGKAAAGIADFPSRSDKAEVLDTFTSRVFVGRQREMSELTAALEEALSGHGRLVMLVGEAGVGKTRTGRELAAIANQRGARVLWGWCYEEAGAPPYWPWVQPLRAYIQQQGPDQLRSQMGPGAADIAEIIPEVRQKLPDPEPPPSLEPEQARFRLFDSITTFLKNAAQSQPLMLVLDDLQWADKPSLLLLQFLARQLADSRLLVVGCYRDVELSRQHPLSEALAQLAREPVFQRQLLRGLSREDTGRFIESAARIRPSERLVETIYEHTKGNPFFMTEVVRLLVQEGLLYSEQLQGVARLCT
jgi:predicted ATPase